MKKTIIGILLCLSCFVSLTGCTKEVKEIQATTVTTESAVVTTTEAVTEITTEDITTVTEQVPEETIEVTTETLIETTTVAIEALPKPSEEVLALLAEASGWTAEGSMFPTFACSTLYVDDNLEVYSCGSMYDNAKKGVYFYDKGTSTMVVEDWTASEFSMEVTKTKYDKENNLFYTYVDYEQNSNMHKGISVYDLSAKASKGISCVYYTAYDLNGAVTDPTDFAFSISTIDDINTYTDFETYVSTIFA